MFCVCIGYVLRIVCNVKVLRRFFVTCKSESDALRARESESDALRASEELDYLGNLGRCAYLGKLGTAKDFRRKGQGTLRERPTTTTNNDDRYTKISAGEGQALIEITPKFI